MLLSQHLHRFTNLLSSLTDKLSEEKNFINNIITSFQPGVDSQFDAVDMNIYNKFLESTGNIDQRFADLENLVKTQFGSSTTKIDDQFSSFNNNLQTKYDALVALINILQSTLDQGVINTIDEIQSARDNIKLELGNKLDSNIAQSPGMMFDPSGFINKDGDKYMFKIKANDFYRFGMMVMIFNLVFMITVILFALKCCQRSGYKYKAVSRVNSESECENIH